MCILVIKNEMKKKLKKLKKKNKKLKHLDLYYLLGKCPIYIFIQYNILYYMNNTYISICVGKILFANKKITS